MNTPHPPLKGAPLVLGTLALALGNFIIVLNTTIANVSIPTISGDLAISMSEGTWIITSYAVAQAITVLMTGWLVQRFGQVRLFVACVLAFMLCSCACAMAWSLESMVLFRVLQGLSGGPLIPLSATVLLSIYPRDKANIAVALWGMTTVVAPIAGPILGGWLCDHYSWPWIFYLSLPLAGLIAASVWWLMRARETARVKIPIDGIGLMLLVVFVGALQLLLDKGKELDWFASPFIIGCAIVAVLALIVLVIWELTEEYPVIDLSVFSSRNWLVSTVVLSLMFGIFFGNMVVTPIWLQQQMGYTAFWAGLALAPMGVLAVVTSPLVGKLLPKMDPRIIVSYGMCVLALSFYLRAQFTTDVDYWTVALPMLVMGAGIPACIVTLTSLGVSDLPPEKVTAGSVLQNFIRVMSMSIGGSLSQTYWDHAGKLKRAELAAISDYSSVLADALGQFSRLLDGQAVMLGSNDFYALACLLMLAFAALVWLVKPAPRAVSVGH